MLSSFGALGFIRNLLSNIYTRNRFLRKPEITTLPTVLKGYIRHECRTYGYRSTIMAFIVIVLFSYIGPQGYTCDEVIIFAGQARGQGRRRAVFAFSLKIPATTIPAISPRLTLLGAHLLLSNSVDIGQTDRTCQENALGGKAKLAEERSCVRSFRCPEVLTPDPTDSFDPTDSLVETSVNARRNPTGFLFVTI
jgi:hypothetical protein